MAQKDNYEKYQNMSRKEDWMKMLLEGDGKRVGWYQGQQYFLTHFADSEVTFWNLSSLRTT